MLPTNLKSRHLWFWEITWKNCENRSL